MTIVEARKRGLKFYNTGRPCLRGHTGDRYVSTGNCVQCLRADMAKRHHDNRESISRRKRARYRGDATHADSVRAAARRWQKNNKPRSNETKRAYRARPDLVPYMFIKLNGLRNSERKGRCPCTVTAAYLRALYEEQQGKCALTGKPLDYISRRVTLNTLSVDRIDKDKGYVPGNIRLVTFQANNARVQGSDEELFDFCRAVLRVARNRKRRST